MSWVFEQDRPIYTQLLEQIRLRIISGEYPTGSKLPSVRDLASEASVNPNTMQKALSELERTNLIYSQRTNGRYITEDTTLLNQIKEDIVKEKIKDFFDQMSSLGLKREEILIQIEKNIKEMNS